ncbi:MAG: hypothetical protein S4CHLAM37_04220 [Chlamydiia bacterium]|nr:hypothetical protein [Chlamydiia bacterium]
MSISSLGHSRNILLGSNTIGFLENSTYKTAMSYLENKVSDFALSVISGATLTIGSVTFILSATVIGFSTSSLIFSLVLLSIGAAALHVIQNVKRYHDSVYLETYKKDAQESFKIFEYLDGIDYFETDDLKKAALRPLAKLEGEHGSLNKLFKHELLSPSDFAKAFCLETKYMNLSETIDFYKKAHSAYLAEKDLDANIPDYTFLENSVWIEKFKNYIGVDAFKAKSVLSVEDLTEANNVIETINANIEFLFEVGVFKQDRKDEILEKSEKFKEKKAEFGEETNEFFVRYNTKHQLLKGFEEKIGASYQVLDSYEDIAKGQFRFWKRVKEIRNEWEVISKDCEEQIKILELAYFPRGENDPSKIEKESDKVLFLAQRNQYKDKLKAAELKHKKNLLSFEKDLRKFVQGAMHDIEKFKKELESENEVEIKALEKSIETSERQFRLEHTDQIKAFQKALVAYHKVIAKDLPKEAGSASVNTRARSIPDSTVDPLRGAVTIEEDLEEEKGQPPAPSRRKTRKETAEATEADKDKTQSPPIVLRRSERIRSSKPKT